jgi:hypothetical protein
MYPSHYLYPNYYVPMPYIRQYPGYWTQPASIEKQYPMQVDERTESLRIEDHGQ